jgi:hypothetical protein
MYTLAARAVQIVGSLGTVLLIVKYTNAVQQGFYYALLSLASLQTVFELGFSFVILQMASHESAELRISIAGEIAGDEVSCSRLASLFGLILRWYFVCAAIFLLVMTPGGLLFFSWKSQSLLGSGIFWPWILAVAATSAMIFLNPMFSFFEGCGEIAPVARLRMQQAAGVTLTSWLIIRAGYPLFACAAVNLSWVALAAAFLVKRRALVRRLFRQKLSSMVSWGSEIWPFQWKIAVAWICSYAMLQIFTPIMFVSRGPVDAGRLGMTLSICGYLQIVALACITPSAASFGRMVAQGNLAELDGTFSRTLRSAWLVFAGLTAACLGCITLVQGVAPGIATRIESPALIAALIVAFAAGFQVQALAVYLRSYKREPFLLLSLVSAMVATGLGLVLVPSMGCSGVVLSLGVSNIIVALPWSFAILKRSRGGVATLLFGQVAYQESGTVTRTTA